MRAEIQMRTGHSFWAKNRHNKDVIDIQTLLKQYWDSKKNEFTASSQSFPPISPFTSDGEAEAVSIGKYDGYIELRFLANTAVRIFAAAQPSQLIAFHRRNLSARRFLNWKNC
jgi:hypothetical protein